MVHPLRNRIQRNLQRLRLAMILDRPELKKRFDNMARALLRHPEAGVIEKELSNLQRRLDDSIHRRHLRKIHRPEVRYPENLPIISYREEILRVIKDNPVVIISGETGSGKTTQIPKFCLEAGRGISGLIGCTQPRRIAAVTVSHRIAEELNEPIGKSVGYKIRFQEKSGEDPYIKIMTDGILLAETARDRMFLAYDTLIIDEAHERSINIDFLLGYLRNLLPKRKDLKLIITSATIDTEKFSMAFHAAPVVEVSGRTYPVEVRYAVDDQKAEEEIPYMELAATEVKGLVRKGVYGDILVFMPTERDIRETCDLLEGMRLKKTLVMPLFARLPAADQKRVFSSAPERKIIVATNVAETSITIPGIRYVIDTGLARLSRFSPSSRANALPVLPVSRSSADQRKGRCGRMENGICIRLFPEADYLSRPLYTPPEILRSNLAEVILKMMALELGNPADFPFIDPPASKWISSGYDILTELGAIEKDASNRFVLTAAGKKMAQMPLDPRISRILLEAEKEHCLTAMSIIAAALSIPDPRETPFDKAKEAREAHRAFSDPDSDFLTLLHLWQHFHQEVGPRGSASGMRQFCKKHFLSARRMRDWQDIRAQILDILAESGLLKKRKIEPGVSLYPVDKNAYRAIHRAILSGFISHIALRKEKNIYTAARGREVMLFPGSGLFNRGGEWIVAAEIVETSRVFARVAANIDASWLEAIGKSRCRYTYGEPFWSAAKNTVMALEKVHLFGLPIDPGRYVPFGTIDPEKASRVFIREALMNGNLQNPPAFVTWNQNLIQNVNRLENKLRRRDLKIPDLEIFNFYRDRLVGVVNLKSLDERIVAHGSDAFLRMREEDLLTHIPDPEKLFGFPDFFKVMGKALPLSYCFNPGGEDDGVTLHVPFSMTSAVTGAELEWLVPGMLPEKIESLIKRLPKNQRRKAPPVSAILDFLPQENSFGRTSLGCGLTQILKEQFGECIPEDQWPMTSLPEHLHMRIVIETPGGECLQSGRAPEVLTVIPEMRKNFNLPQEIASAKEKLEKEGITHWSFGDLPETVNLEAPNHQEWIFFPALERDPKQEGARLRLFSFFDESRASHPHGVAALFEVHYSRSLKDLGRSIDLSVVSNRLPDRFGGEHYLRNQVLERVSADLFRKDIRAQKDFEAHVKMISGKIHTRGMEILEKALVILNAFHAAGDKFHSLERAYHSNRSAIIFLSALRTHLKHLVPDNFIQLYHDDRLFHLPRYLHALAIRAQKGVIDLKKDQKRSLLVAPFIDELKKILETLSPSSSDGKRKALENLFWLIEEFKVSVFSQELKTPFPVSVKTLRLEIEAVRHMN